MTLFLALNAFAGKYSEPSEKEISETLETFKYKNSWIHPLIIHEFLPWMSDYSVPLITGIDVAAATGTNRFFGKIIAKENLVSATDDKRNTTQYEWLGRLKNGMHAIVVSESGDGSMVAKTLAIFSLQKRPSTNETGKTYNRLELTIERFVILGDRGVSTISLKENSILVDVKCDKTCDSKNFTVQF